MAMGNAAIQFLRGSAEAISNNSGEVPDAGQPVFDLTNNKLYIGNGSDTLNSLPAFATEKHLYQHLINFTIDNYHSGSYGNASIVLYNSYSGKINTYDLIIEFTGMESESSGHYYPIFVPGYYDGSEYIIYGLLTNGVRRSNFAGDTVITCETISISAVVDKITQIF